MIDEEIENLNLGSKTEDLESVMVIPNKHFPLVDKKTPIGPIPRKSFQKDPENAGNEGKKSEELEIVEKRRSSISGLKIPKSWKPKPNLKSTKNLSKCNLIKKTNSPSQVRSTLNSINPNTPTTSKIEKHKSPSRIFKNLFPYEVEQFLEEVMGEELLTLFSNGNRNMRDRNNTEFLSDVRPKTPQSAPSNSILKRPMSLYRSMSKRFKKKLLRDQVDKPWDPYTRLINIRLDDKLQHLCHELNIQQTAIYQASKALDYCNSSEELANSSYLLDLDQVILVANRRKQVIFEGIKDLFSPRSNTPNSSETWGEITVRNIFFHLETHWIHAKCDSSRLQCIVFVVSQGLTVISTKAYIYRELKDSVYLACNFSSQMLRPDFKINIKVYGLKTEKRITFNFKRGEYHIQVDKSNTPPSPKCHEVKFSGIRESSFELVGLMDLQFNDLHYTYPQLLVISRKSPDALWSRSPVCNLGWKNSVLQQILKVELEYSFKFHSSISHSGFLTLGCIQCNRFVNWIGRVWCVLEGHAIKAFRNDSDQKKGKSPALILYLTYDGSDVITSVDETLCSKSRTFIIKKNSCKPKTDNILSFLFHCDTKDDFSEWMTMLRQTRLLLHKWNVRKPPRY